MCVCEKEREAHTNKPFECPGRLKSPGEIIHKVARWRLYSPAESRFCDDFSSSVIDRSELVYCKSVCSTRDINYNPVHASTWHQNRITSWYPTYLLGPLDAMDSDDSDDEFDGYVDLQDYTHSSTDVHIQEETTDYQDSIL